MVTMTLCREERGTLSRFPQIGGITEDALYFVRFLIHRLTPVNDQARY
jgi:hypothetical protein